MPPCGRDEGKAGAVFKQKTQAQWCEIMEGTDVCFAPVLNFMDAPRHPANVARDTYIEVDGITQPAPAPRFSRTPSRCSMAATMPVQDTDAVLTAMGFGEQELADSRHRALSSERNHRGSPMSDYETVLIERYGSVAVVTLNRPTG